ASTSMRRYVTRAVGRSVRPSRPPAMARTLLRADPFGEGREHRHGGFRALTQDRLEVLAADCQDADVFALGDHRGDSRSFSEDGQLPDVVARPVASDEPLATIRLD